MPSFPGGWPARSAIVVLAEFDHACLLGGVSGIRLERQPVGQLGLIRVVRSRDRFLMLLRYVRLRFVKASVGHRDPLWKAGTRPMRRGFSVSRTYCRMATVEER